jgi:hypothetical protein
VVAYATLSDLTDRFPRALTDEETALADTMLADASFLLSMRVYGLQNAIDNGQPGVAQAAMLLVVAMVRRALLAMAAQAAASPNVDSVSEAWGTYSQSVKYRSDNGALFLYQSEIDDIFSQIYGTTAAAISMRSPGL